MNIVIMGPPGSGKSTQARILAGKLDLTFVKTGDIYRELSKEATPLGEKIKSVIDSGGLVDDETTLEVVDKNLAEITSGFIVDGFPRTLVQAKRNLFPINKVVNINISDEEAVKRIIHRAESSGRADDTREVVLERLKLYHESTEPILEYYKNQGILLEVDGAGTIEEVAAQIEV